MIYKSVSVKYAVADILSQLQLQSNNQVDNVIEWIAKAMDAIGCHSEFTLKEKDISIANHRECLPCDLYKINQVCYQGSPLKYGSQTFDYKTHCSDCINASASSSESYVINNGYIKTSFEEGDITLFYYAFPTDEEGLPLVPEDYSFFEAFLWFVILKLMMGGWEHPNKSISYELADAKWQYYCAQARNKAKMPDLDRMEGLHNQWVKMVPDRNAWSQFFSELNSREMIDRNVVKRLIGR